MELLIVRRPVYYLGSRDKTSCPCIVCSISKDASSKKLLHGRGAPSFFLGPGRLIRAIIFSPLRLMIRYGRIAGRPNNYAPALCIAGAFIFSLLLTEAACKPPQITFWCNVFLFSLYIFSFFVFTFLIIKGFFFSFLFFLYFC